jgi:hypothetical protein
VEVLSDILHECEWACPPDQVCRRSLSCTFTLDKLTIVRACTDVHLCLSWQLLLLSTSRILGERGGVTERVRVGVLERLCCKHLPLEEDLA